MKEASNKTIKHHYYEKIQFHTITLYHPLYFDKNVTSSELGFTFKE
jgi:hypothetical protein